MSRSVAEGGNRGGPDLGHRGLVELGRSGLRGGPIEPFLAEAMRLVASQLASPHVALLEHSRSGDELTGRAAWYQGTPILGEVVENLRLPLGEGSFPGYVLEQGTSVVSEDLLGDRRFRARAPEYRVPSRSAVAVPIEIEGAAWGVLAAYDDQLRSWCGDEVWFLEAVASTVGLAVQRRRSEEAMEAARRRSTRLSDATRDFAAHLDHRDVLDDLARVASLEVADVAVVSQWVGQGFERVAVHSKHADAAEAVDELSSHRAGAGHSGLWSEEAAAATHDSILHARVSDEHLRAVAVSPQHLERLRGLGITSILVVPLVARGTLLGVLTLVRLGDDDSFGSTEREWAEELASRAALAADNSRLLANHQTAVSALQGALLPPLECGVPGYEMGATYRAADDLLTVGGDFYDVIETADGSWCVVIGDVSGRGPVSAAITGVVRQSIRTAALSETVPSRVLALANRAVCERLEPGLFCTAVLATFHEPVPGETGRVTVSVAGHPAPLVLGIDGSVAPLSTRGLPLGVERAAAFSDRRSTIEPGAALVLHTDGITEARRGPEFFGEERLAATLSGVARLDAAAVAQRLCEAVDRFAGCADDDRAVVVLRRKR